MSAHTEAHLPAYAERDLAASLEKLGISPDSEEGAAAREKAYERHQNKLLAARVRRAAKKAALSSAAPEVDDDEKKVDGADSSASNL